MDERINLEKNPNLKDIFLQDYKTHVSFFDQKNPSSGELELVFSGKPIELKEWTITNYSGEKTRILLDKLIINQPVNKNLFDIGQEITLSPIIIIEPKYSLSEIINPPPPYL